MSILINVIGVKTSVRVSHHLVERVLQFCLLWVFGAAEETELRFSDSDNSYCRISSDEVMFVIGPETL